MSSSEDAGIVLTLLGTFSYIIRGSVSNLCSAATGTILNRFSISMYQNLRVHQGFKSYFLSQAGKSTVWPVNELKRRHWDRAYLTRHFLKLTATSKGLARY